MPRKTARRAAKTPAKSTTPATPAKVKREGAMRSIISTLCSPVSIALIVLLVTRGSSVSNYVRAAASSVGSSDASFAHRDILEPQVARTNDETSNETNTFTSTIVDVADYVSESTWLGMILSMFDSGNPSGVNGPTCTNDSTSYFFRKCRLILRKADKAVSPIYGPKNPQSDEEIKCNVWSQKCRHRKRKDAIQTIQTLDAEQPTTPRSSPIPEDTAMDIAKLDSSDMRILFVGMAIPSSIAIVYLMIRRAI